MIEFCVLILFLIKFQRDLIFFHHDPKSKSYNFTIQKKYLYKIYKYS